MFPLAVSTPSSDNSAAFFWVLIVILPSVIAITILLSIYVPRYLKGRNYGVVQPPRKLAREGSSDPVPPNAPQSDEASTAMPEQFDQMTQRFGQIAERLEAEIKRLEKLNTKRASMETGAPFEQPEPSLPAFPSAPLPVASQSNQVSESDLLELYRTSLKDFKLKAEKRKGESFNFASLPMARAAIKQNQSFELAPGDQFFAIGADRNDEWWLAPNPNRTVNRDREADQIYNDLYKIQGQQSKLSQISHIEEFAVLKEDDQKGGFYRLVRPGRLILRAAD